MSWSRTLSRLALSLAAIGTGCEVGDLPAAAPGDASAPGAPAPDGGGEVSARHIFDDQVAPVLRARCAACHGDQNGVTGPDFLGPDDDYHGDLLAAVDIAGRPLVGVTAADSPLVQKGAHAGPAFADAEVEAIDRWLAAAAAEAARVPDAGPAPGAPDLTTALAWFASCMTYDDWTAHALDQLPATLTDRGPCYSCHAAGEHGTYLSEDARATYDAHADPARPTIARLVRGTYDGGQFTGLEPARAYVTQGAVGGVHPRYSLAEPVLTGLDAFVAQAIEASRAGPCP